MPCILTRCGAFLLPGCNTAKYKPLQRVLPCQCNYIAHAAKQRTGLYSGFSCDCPRSTANDTRPTQADIMPSATRWSAHTHRDAPHRYQIPAPRRTLYRLAQPPYYNKVYKGAADCRLCKPGGGLDTSHARRLAIWHRSAVRAHRLAPSTRRGSPAAGRSWRRGTIGGSRRISFRAFAR